MYLKNHPVFFSRSHKNILYVHRKIFCWKTELEDSIRSIDDKAPFAGWERLYFRIGLRRDSNTIQYRNLLHG